MQFIEVSFFSRFCAKDKRRRLLHQHATHNMSPPTRTYKKVYFSF